ncbi:MAG: 50S ribosomal protein L18e [Candidatus Hadarchaeum sp.]|uniref:50S ribosomal protein L18e n=1 Tax=Candidatus Hadarchaeum sp. TaxID=2883567 RepID=UPI003D113835
MPKPTGPTNPQLRKLLRLLREQGKKHGAQIWLDLAERLERPRRSRAEVNLSQINRYAQNGSTVVVPGKVLAAGRLSHPVMVAALSFSVPAKRKIIAAGGTVLSLQQLVEQNPTGREVKLME